MDWKRCRKCGSEKPLTDFSPDRRMKTGVKSWCKSCAATDKKQRRDMDIERYRDMERARERLPHVRAQRKAYLQTAAAKEARARACRSYWARNPERLAARTAVNHALRDGKLQKLPCLVCGSKHVEGHHPDYSQPLAVVWLCNDHHRAAHEIT